MRPEGNLEPQGSPDAESLLCLMPGDWRNHSSADRAKALECEERAEQTGDPFIKQQLIEIAEKWRHMAAHLEKYSR